MVGRNDGVIVAALQIVAQAMQNNQNRGNGEFRNMGKFQRNSPPTFKGRYVSDGAQDWLKDIEKIFRVIVCTEAYKVQFGTHMLEEEADDLWDNTRQRLEAVGDEIT
ncbi:unnamed protein product [Lathyrus oleraceus]